MNDAINIIDAAELRLRKDLQKDRTVWLQSDAHSLLIEAKRYLKEGRVEGFAGMYADNFFRTTWRDARYIKSTPEEFDKWREEDQEGFAQDMKFRQDGR
jgi:hypothetical protein